MSDLATKRLLAKAETGSNGLKNALKTSNLRLITKYQDDLKKCVDSLLDARVELEETDESQELLRDVQKCEAEALDLVFQADQAILAREETDQKSASAKVKTALVSELSQELKSFSVSLDESPKDALEENEPNNEKSFLASISSRKTKLLAELKVKKSQLVENYQVPEAELQALVTLVQEADSKLETWLTKAAAVGSPSEPLEPKPHNPDVKIDRLALPVFDGSARNYSRFINAFNSTVGIAYQDPSVKLLYLKGQCLKSEPQELIKSVTDFDEAISRLKQKYGRTELVISEALKDLDSLKLDSNNEAKSIVRLSSAIESIVDDTKAVDAFDDFCNIVTLGSIESKLPERLLVKWVERKLSLQDKTIKDKVNVLISFLKQEAKVAESLLTVKVKPKQHAESKWKPKPFNGNLTDQTQGKHEDSKQCFRCGKPNHTAKECHLPKSVTCRYCKGRGHLERACLKKKNPITKPRNVSDSDKVNKTETSASEKSEQRKHVTFSEDPKSRESIPTDTVNANTHGVNVRLPFDILNTNVGHCNVLWDSGSTLNLIKTDFAEEKGLQGKSVDLTYKLVNGDVSNTHTKLYQIVLLSKSGHKRHIHAYGISSIMDSIPGLDLTQLAKRYDIVGANVDNISVPQGNIQLLVGAVAISDFPKPTWSKNNVVLMNTQFGIHDYLLCGSNTFFSHDTSVNHMATIEIKQVGPDPVCERIVGHVDSVNRQAMLKDFWSVEDLGVKTPTLCKACLNCQNCKIHAVNLTERDARDYTMVKNNLSYNPDELHWEAEYPFVSSPQVLRDNRSDALQSLKSCESRLSRDENLKNLYAQQVEDFRSRNVIRKLSDEEIKSWDGPVRYVSHHEVHKPGATTPLRLVVNSSFKRGHEKSLNDILLKGPNVLNDMFSVMIRWRFFNVAFVGDISKMYHNIYTGETEGHVRRMLWRDFDVDRPPDTYVFQRVTFGDRPAGCIAVVALQQTADMFSAISPMAAKILKHDSYMDDIVSGSDSLEGAFELIEDIKAIAARGGFNFKDFVVSGNSQQPQDSLAKDVSVLGLLWSPVDDNLKFNLSLNPNKKVKGSRKSPDKPIEEIDLTKRICLRLINSIYDPFGVLVPLTVLLKIKMKEYFVLQNNHLTWDSALSQTIQGEFKRIFLQLMSLMNFKLPRSVNVYMSPDVETKLVCFTDASKQAFCAVVYVCTSSNHDTFQVRFLVAKSRVSPVKEESIPRLELLGVLLGIRLLAKIKKALNIKLNDVLLLTDSKCVLGMIHNGKTPLHDFVGTRVHEIRAHLPEVQFAWVQSQSNIADLGSRGGDSNSISESSQWIVGPQWLKTPLEKWPIERVSRDSNLEADEFVSVIDNAVNEPLINAKRFSDLDHLIRVTAYCILFFRSKDNSKSSINADWTKVILTADIYNAAEAYWVRTVSQGVAQSIEKLLSLRPKKVYDDAGNVIQVVTSGRLNNMMNLGYDVPELVILDPHHPFTKLVLKKFHDERHASDDYVLWRSRTKYWIPNARRVIRSIRNKCYRCRLLNRRCQSQLMATLPDFRLLPCPPFTNVALDLFGPLQHSDLVRKRLTSKCWGVVITCLNCRAVYLDLAPSYDTDSFLQVLRRFMNLHGTPSRIISDQGSQLIAASKEVEGMLELLDWNFVKGWTAKQRIEWDFVPVKGQHVNGCAEAMVKSTKKLLSVVLESKRLTFPELQTVLFEVAQILNCRPLGIYHKPGTDPLDGGPITPNHLLLGRATSAVPSFKYEENVSLTKRIRFINSIIQEFWQKFKATVYPSLIPTYKWQKEKRVAKIGDVVLLDVEDSKVGHYVLGRVIGIKANKDNLPRTLSIQYVVFDSRGNPLRRTTSRSIHSSILIVPVEEQTS